MKKGEFSLCALLKILFVDTLAQLLSAAAGKTV